MLQNTKANQLLPTREAQIQVSSNHLLKDSNKKLEEKRQGEISRTCNDHDYSVLKS